MDPHGGSQTQPNASGPPQGRNEAVLPVTIRTIHNAIEGRMGDEVRFFGIEPSQLVVVAVIEQIVKQPHCIELRVNDGSARFQAKYYMSAEKQQEDLGNLDAGMYISGVGSLRMTPSPHLGLVSLQRVVSANEVSYHAIESALAALKLQHKNEGGEKMVWTPPSKSQTYESTLDANIEKNTPPKDPQGLTVPLLVPPMHVESVEPCKKDASVRDAILNFLQSTPSDDEKGCHINTIIKTIGASTDAVGEATKQLVEEGHIYPTIDDDHFAAI